MCVVVVVVVGERGHVVVELADVLEVVVNRERGFAWRNMKIGRHEGVRWLSVGVRVVVVL
jgi:hypothetical protein